MSDAPHILPQSADSAETARSGSRILLAQALVIGVLVALAYRPALDLVTYKWRTDGNWSHGWLVPVFSLYFLIIHRQELLSAPRRSNYAGLLVITASLAVYYWSLHFNQFVYLQAFSLVPCLLGVVLLVCGWPVLRRAWFPIAFLLCAIPFPDSMYFEFTLPLRRLASRVGGAVLGLLPGVDTEVKGVVIDYMYEARTAALNVEEACSGMRLMMAFCTLGIAMAYLGDRPLWQRLVMIACCIPIAMLCNTIRVVSTGLLHIYGYKEWSQGTAHGLLGLAMLPIALGLFALCGYVLSNLFIEEEAEAAGRNDTEYA